MENNFQCTKCKLDINESDRVPIYICQHLICKKCTLEQDPQQQEIFCVGCDKSHKLDGENLITNDLILSLYKQFHKNSNKITCDNHDGKEVEYFCKKEKCLHCSICVQDHFKHTNQMSYFDSKDVRDEAKKLNENLQVLKNDIETKQATLNQIMNQEKAFKGQEIVDILESSSSLIESTTKNFDSMFRNSIDSLILNEKAHQEYVHNELVNQQKMKLIYRGSRDGFGTQDFYNKCENKGKTISFIKTTQNEIIGGQTTAHWKSDGSSWSKDNKAFLFSVNHCQKMKVVSHNYAIQNHSDFGMKFGSTYGGLFVKDNCDRRRDNGCIMNGEYYEKANGSAAHLATLVNFQVEEFEVFTVG